MVDSECMDQNKIECALCKELFRRITNTHLWKAHRMSMGEYKTQFPDEPTDAPGLASSRVDHLRGKTYEEVYGKEKSEDLKKVRKKDAIKQMEDEAQIAIRKEKCGYEYTDEQKIKLSESKTVHGGFTYRQRAFDYYGFECRRCGKTYEKGSLVVHHKDFMNILSELGNHSIENLMVLCKSCHAKLHNEVTSLQTGFIGINDIEKGMHYILIGLKKEFGLDLSDVNFEDTPKRVARAYFEIFHGLKNTNEQIENIFSSKFPSEGYDQMIISPDNLVYSMCPHHFLPVEYKISVGYIPSEEGFVLGVSKLGRLIEILAKQPVLQEALTKRIAKEFERVKPLGVAVKVEGNHYCMRMRGIKSQSTIVTSYTSGVFREELATREEFMRLIK